MLNENISPYERAEKNAMRAARLFDEREMENALEAIQSALEINPDNHVWRFNEGLTLDSLDRFKEALEAFKLALEGLPDDLDVLNCIAVDQTRLGHYDLAIKTFEYIQKMDPDFHFAYCNRITAYIDMDLFDQAEEMFYLAQQIGPDCPICYYNMGLSLFNQGKYKEAILCWMRTFELEPEHPEINHRMAQAWWLLGKTIEARERFLEELRRDPSNIEAILDFGLFLLDTGNIDCAREKFNRILEYQPNNASALFYLGEIAFHNGEYPNALHLFEKALKMDQNLPGPWYRRAQYGLIIGNRDSEKTCLDNLMCREKIGNDVLISMASMFLELGDINSAEDCMAKIIDSPRDDHLDSRFLYFVGFVFFKKRKFSDAMEIFEYLLNEKPDDSFAMKGFIITCLMAGKHCEAKGHIEKAISLDMYDLGMKSLNMGLWLAQQLKRTSSRRYLKRISRMCLAWLMECLNRKAEAMLEEMLRPHYLEWFPNTESCVNPGISIVNLRNIPLMVRKADWRISRNRQEKGGDYGYD